MFVFVRHHNIEKIVTVRIVPYMKVCVLRNTNCMFAQALDLSLKEASHIRGTGLKLSPRLYFLKR